MSLDIQKRLLCIKQPALCLPNRLNRRRDRESVLLRLGWQWLLSKIFHNARCGWVGIHAMPACPAGPVPSFSGSMLSLWPSHPLLPVQAIAPWPAIDQ